MVAITPGLEQERYKEFSKKLDRSVQRPLLYVYSVNWNRNYVIIIVIYFYEMLLDFYIRSEKIR